MKFKILVTYTQIRPAAKILQSTLAISKKKLELTQNSKYDVTKNQTFCLEVLFESYWDMYLAKSS